MRYIISPSQFHSLVYKYLDGIFSKQDFRKAINKYAKDTWTVEMFSDKGLNLISYWGYGPGEYDDGSPHNGIGSLQIHPDIVDRLRSNLTVRESKIIDIIADWVTEKLDVDIDEVSIFPNRSKPVSY
jgi:hypothetical protein